MKTKYWFLSRQVLGGLLAGVGLGVIIANTLVATPEHHVVVGSFVYIAAWAGIAVGALLARSAHRSASV
jgi:hypothetical protein